MGEKETALVGLPTLLMPANELEQYNMEGEETRHKEEKWYDIGMKFNSSKSSISLFLLPAILKSLVV